MPHTVRVQVVFSVTLDVPYGYLNITSSHRMGGEVGMTAVAHQFRVGVTFSVTGWI
jgi:2-hydroxychromene-2-carboxylate isomerase